MTFDLCGDEEEEGAGGEGGEEDGGQGVPSEAERKDHKVDIMAQQYKYIACLKVSTVVSVGGSFSVFVVFRLSGHLAGLGCLRLSGHLAGLGCLGLSGHLAGLGCLGLSLLSFDCQHIHHCWGVFFCLFSLVCQHSHQCWGVFFCLCFLLSVSTVINVGVSFSVCVFFCLSAQSSMLGCLFLSVFSFVCQHSHQCWGVFFCLCFLLSVSTVINVGVSFSVCVFFCLSAQSSMLGCLFLSVFSFVCQHSHQCWGVFFCLCFLLSVSTVINVGVSFSVCVFFCLSAQSSMLGCLFLFSLVCQHSHQCWGVFFCLCFLLSVSTVISVGVSFSVCFLLSVSTVISVGVSFSVSVFSCLSAQSSMLGCLFLSLFSFVCQHSHQCWGVFFCLCFLLSVSTVINVGVSFSVFPCLSAQSSVLGCLFLPLFSLGYRGI